MHRTLAVVLLAGLALVPPALAQPSPGKAPAAARDKAAESLPIRRITMYRSGVASLERRGLIDGDARLQFRFNTDQINDILKSMFVLDLSKGQGRIDGISYGSREPLAKRLASFGVDISDEPPLGTILARLRGAGVTFTLPEGRVSGVILGGETRPQAGAGSAVIQVPFVNVVTPDGIRSVNLTTVLGVELTDKELNGELMKALTALAEYRADRTKTVDVNLSGAGARDIVVGYVQEAPVWKASYRLVLPEGSGSGAKDAPAKESFTIQGWAIVENTTDEDWRDVTLSLVSGRPVSFRMDLYEPLYVWRPEVPVPTVPGVAPRTYAGGEAVEADRPSGGVAFGSGAPALKAPGAPPAPAADAAERRAYRMERGEGAKEKKLDAEDMAGYAARAQAQVVEAGEVFQFELDHPITVERQRSAMLPIISSGIEGRRVSIYNPSDGSDHPMRGIEIVNTTNLQLLPGPVSVFDNGVYAGDAQIGHVPKADKRLLAYSVDLDMTFTRKDTGQEELRRARVVKGLLEMQSKSRTSTSFTFTNKDQARPRVLIVEWPKQGGWDLAPGLTAYEQTDALYRFQVDVAPGKQATQEIAFERVNVQTYQLTSYDLNTLLAYGKQGKVSDAVVNAFREAARRQGVISDLQRQIASLEKEKAEIDADQNRVRQNMSANTIDRQSELYARYIKKLGEQETRLEAISDATGRARGELAKAQNELNDYLANLNVE